MNGVDTEGWSPDKDPLIPHTYTAQDLSGKAVCKAELQQEVGLEQQPGAMLCAAIGRLAHQKGYDILAQAAPGMTESGLQLALLGTGDTALEEEFAALAMKDRGRISAPPR